MTGVNHGLFMTFSMKIFCYTGNRRVKRREGKPLRFARAIRATIFTPLDAPASTVLAGLVRKV